MDDAWWMDDGWLVGWTDGQTGWMDEKPSQEKTHDLNLKQTVGWVRGWGGGF